LTGRIEPSARRRVPEQLYHLMAEGHGLLHPLAVERRLVEGDEAIDQEGVIFKIAVQARFAFAVRPE